MTSMKIANRVLRMVGTSVLCLLLIGVVGHSVANRGTESVKMITGDSLPSIQIVGAARQEYMAACLDVYVLSVISFS